MAKKKVPYKEGDVFMFPLRKGGFARGVVARMDGKGGIFGYFYGPKFNSIEDAKQVKDISPNNTIERRMFGDLGLLNGEWSVIGQIENWNRIDWPMPPLIRIDEHCGKAWLSEYDEKTFNCISEKQVDPGLKNKYPEDSLSGYGAIEIRIALLLDK